MTAQSANNNFDVIVIGSGMDGRMMSDALSPRTPVDGLFLSGQDVMTPGIAASLWSGVLTAAAIDPRVYSKMR